MFAIIRTRWQTRPLSCRARRRSSAAPGSLRKKYAGIVYPPNMVRLPNHSTTSGTPRKPVLELRSPRNVLHDPASTAPEIKHTLKLAYRLSAIPARGKIEHCEYLQSLRLIPLSQVHQHIGVAGEI